MRKESVFFWSVLLIVLIPKPAAAAIRYNVTDLGTLPGYDVSHPYSINNKGQIAGYVFNVTTGDIFHRAVLYDANGTGNNIDLGTLGGQQSAALSINNKGQIVGTAMSDSDPSTSYATIFDPNGAANNISLNIEGMAVANNDHGLIVGLSRPAPPYVNAFVVRATLFRPDEEPCVVDLGTLPGYDSAIAYSINNNGVIVGLTFHYQDCAPCGISRAVLFDPSGDGNNIDLGTLPGYDYATPFSINDRGQIVGRVNSNNFYFPENEFNSRAVLFDATGHGNNIDLGTLPGYDSAEAFSINNKGWIVGRTLPMDQTRAVLFDRKYRGNNIDLNDCIDPALGCILTEPISINDNGLIICWGGKSGSDATAFLLKPISAGTADFEPDTDVDLEDYAILAAAWRSTPADDNWNQFCDISDPSDDLIDERDLAVFAENYLMQSP